MAELIDKVYPGKALLFGEYTVIHGGNSLAIPLYSKTANWDFDDLEFESRDSIDKFIDYLVVQGIGSVDLEKFSSAWESGLFLESNIPSGYGAGSSGSVVAAIYDAFMEHGTQETTVIREIFKKMEDYFHGSSSGLDPLVSYFGQAVLIQDQKLSLLDVDSSILENLYLWDSGYSRKTAPLVDWYKEKLEQGLVNSIEEKLIPANNQLIDSFLTNSKVKFTEAFQQVENFQLKYFTPMFPAHIKKDIMSIKEQYNCNFKLCGAGGGGYYLVYCENKEIIKESKMIALVM